MADPGNADKQDFTSLMNALARAHHRFSLFEAEILRNSGSGLTATQARVIFCLGNTEGMTCSEITEMTLITKGTLTGVIDRLEDKDLVQRWSDAEDGRRIIVDLSRKGKRLFEREYPGFLAHLKPRFEVISKSNRTQTTSLLMQIADQF